MLLIISASITLTYLQEPGVGKTTLARILAKCLNCETDITSTPCGMCNACKEIKEGRFIDLIEVDAASRTKVEDTRELLENVQYSPASARFKVYLIDEVHMLSNHSFNLYLKRSKNRHLTLNSFLRQLIHRSYLLRYCLGAFSSI